MISTPNTTPEKVKLGQKLRDDIRYSIETNNNFATLSECDAEVNETNLIETKTKLSECKIPKIDHTNYKTAFEDFLTNFKEVNKDSPKYPEVASEMMIKNYNMFHVQLKDVRKFNPNLGGFFAANAKSLSSEITEVVQKFIGDLGLGLLKNGLHFNLIGGK